MACSFQCLQTTHSLCNEKGCDCHCHTPFPKLDMSTEQYVEWQSLFKAPGTN